MFDLDGRCIEERKDRCSVFLGRFQVPGVRPGSGERVILFAYAASTASCVDVLEQAFLIRLAQFFTRLAWTPEREEASSRSFKGEFNDLIAVFNGQNTGVVVFSVRWRMCWVGGGESIPRLCEDRLDFDVMVRDDHPEPVRADAGPIPGETKPHRVVPKMAVVPIVGREDILP
ncbi:MAG: hypothetical protein AAFV53_13300 [Myxococcota bacterium]